jgi:hypothetical protein
MHVHKKLGCRHPKVLLLFQDVYMCRPFWSYILKTEKKTEIKLDINLDTLIV